LDSRGLANLKSGNVARALEDYDAALKMRPNSEFSLYGRGLAKLKTGDRDGADVDIKAAKAISANIEEVFKGYNVR
jgi:Flp pilus assembly protein TadD